MMHLIIIIIYSFDDVHMMDKPRRSRFAYNKYKMPPLCSFFPDFIIDVRTFVF